MRVCVFPRCWFGSSDNFLFHCRLTHIDNSHISTDNNRQVTSSPARRPLPHVSPTTASPTVTSSSTSFTRHIWPKDTMVLVWWPQTVFLSGKRKRNKTFFSQFMRRHLFFYSTVLFIFHYLERITKRSSDVSLPRSIPCLQENELQGWQIAQTSEPRLANFFVSPELTKAHRVPLRHNFPPRRKASKTSPRRLLHRVLACLPPRKCPLYPPRAPSSLPAPSPPAATPR